MKIEIDSEDLFELKKKVEEQAVRISQLEDDLYQANPNKVQEDVRKKAYELFEGYIKAVFKSIGFKDSHRVVDFDCGYWHNVRNGDWAEVENMEANVGAHIEKDFKRAFLRIGVKTE